MNPRPLLHLKHGQRQDGHRIAQRDPGSDPQIRLEADLLIDVIKEGGAEDVQQRDKEKCPHNREEHQRTGELAPLALVVELAVEAHHRNVQIQLEDESQ